MTIITIYMQVPSLPAHEQSTHSISYLIWIIQTNLSFLPSFLCTLYNPNKRDETSTASRSLFQYWRRQRRWRRRFVSYLPILPMRSELNGDSIFSSRPSTYSSLIVHSFCRANEEPRNTPAALADPWISLYRAWAIAITLHRCRAGRTHLRQISISNKNLRNKASTWRRFGEIYEGFVVTLCDLFGRGHS